MVKFLIIRFSSIGDIVLTTPVVRCLKQQVDKAEIHFLVKKQFLKVIEANPYIDKIHVFDNNLKKIIKQLKKEEFHYIIDLHNNIRSFRVKKSLKGLPFTVNKINFKKWLMVNFKIDKLPRIHITDRYLNTVKLFDVKNDGKGLDFFIHEKDQVNTTIFSQVFQKGYIAFVIGAKHNTKRLPKQKIIAICQKIELPLVFIGGKEDYDLGQTIEKSIKTPVHNACGIYNIAQSASIIKQATLVITHDTGSMHIAAAFKQRIISIWGNTIPEFGMYPYQPDKNSEIFELKNLKCRPCSKIGFKKCPKKHFRCMNDIDENKIVESALKLWNIHS